MCLYGALLYSIILVITDNYFTIAKSVAGQDFRGECLAPPGTGNMTDAVEFMFILFSLIY